MILVFWVFFGCMIESEIILMFWVLFVHDSMSNCPSFWFGFCFGLGESLALKSVLLSGYERAWHKNLFCFIINHTAHSLLHPSRTLENQSLSWSSPQLEWLLLGFTMSWLKMMKMMVLKLNVVVAAWTPSDDADDERWGWWSMTKTLIISVVIIIVVVQSQAPRALLQSVPNKKSLHMLLRDLSSCSWWWWWCQRAGWGVCGGQGNSISTQVKFWFGFMIVLCFVFWFIFWYFCVFDDNLCLLFVGSPYWEGKGLGIGVRFGHKILGSNFTHCVIDIWNIMYAYDGLGMFHTNASI